MERISHGVMSGAIGGAGRRRDTALEQLFETARRAERDTDEITREREAETGEATATRRRNL